MERETREFATPAGHKVLMRTYLTGREANEVKTVMYSAVRMNIEDAQSGKVKIGDIPGTFLVEQEQKAMGLVLLSLDGNADNVLERLLDLPSTEYDAVKVEVDKITNPTTPEKPAQLGGGISQAA